jgi:hypothetical protein
MIVLKAFTKAQQIHFDAKRIGLEAIKKSYSLAIRSMLQRPKEELHTKADVLAHGTTTLCLWTLP